MVWSPAEMVSVRFADAGVRADLFPLRFVAFAAGNGVFSSLIKSSALLACGAVLFLLRDDRIDDGGSGGIVKAKGVPVDLRCSISFAPVRLERILSFVPLVLTLLYPVFDMGPKTARNGDDWAGMCCR